MKDQGRIKCFKMSIKHKDYEILNYLTSTGTLWFLIPFFNKVCFLFELLDLLDLIDAVMVDF